MNVAEAGGGGGGAIVPAAAANPVGLFPIVGFDDFTVGSFGWDQE